MNVHTRLLVGYGYLVSLLVVSAAGAALGFRELAATMGRSLDQHLQGVRASISMLEELENQDRAVLGLLAGDREATALLEESETRLRETLAKAQAQTSGEAAEVLRSIAERYESYRSSRDDLLLKPQGDLFSSYARDVTPRFEALQEQMRQYLNVHYRAMADADRAIEATANRRALLHGLLVALALLSVAFLSGAMRRNILERLQELRSVAEAIASGDRTRRASTLRDDELGLVARGFNSVLDRIQELEGEAGAAGARYRQILLGMLHQGAVRGALVSLGGDILVSMVTETEERQIRQALGDLDFAQPRTQEVASGNTRIRFERLATGDGRPVGWLARVES